MKLHVLFQFSIGDADSPTGPRAFTAVHISFQFSIGDAGLPPGDGYLMAVLPFQFSIGDAGSCGVLYVWVFKFFVCVLARWCLAGLCGLLCLVYR